MLHNYTAFLIKNLAINPFRQVNNYIKTTYDQKSVWAKK